MWDPRAYRDTDFGLLPGEQFEPDEGAEIEPDLLDSPHIMTVLGPIEPDEVGICLPFEHVLVDSQESNRRSAGARLDRLDLAAMELEHFTSLGGRSIVDVSTATEGRTPHGLIALTQRVPSHIVAAGAPDHDTADSSELADERVRGEFANGIDGTGVRAGVLNLQPSLSQAGIAGALRAASQVGCPIYGQFQDLSTFHTILDQAAAVGITPGQFIARVEIDHPQDMTVANVCDLGATAAIALAPDPRRALEEVIAALQAGHLSSILVSLGATSPGHLVSYGGQPGWAYLLEHLVLDVMHAGGTAETVRQLLVENPARVLTITPNDRGEAA